MDNRLLLEVKVRSDATGRLLHFGVVFGNVGNELKADWIDFCHAGQAKAHMATELPLSECAMIQLIVKMYRGAVGVVFGIGLLIAALMIAASGFPHGVLGALGVVLATVLLTGISAVLLSINEHLAALRDRRD